MKKLKLILCMLLVAVCAAAFAVFTACKDEGGTGNNSNTEQTGGGSNTDGGNTNPDGGNTNPDDGNTNPDDGNNTPALKDILGVTLSGDTFTYDGQAHSLEISGNLPEGVSVVYENNGHTDAGTYTVKATVSGEGYNTLILNATLTIDKATLTGITMVGDTVTYDGQAHSLEIVGTLPEGVSVVYENNGQTEPGLYTVKAILSGKNYNTLELTAELHILPTLSSLAQTIIDSFGATPDLWEFLPDSFRLDVDNAYTGPQTIDFTTAKSISSIPVEGKGKQLDVIYGTVIDMQNLLGYVSKVYGATGSIVDLYQQHINAHPDDYKVFEGQTDGGALGFRIELEDEQYKLLVKLGPANIELYSNSQEGSYAGRVQITDSNALKFEVEENSLTIALNILNHAVRQLIFIRTDSGVSCHMYETLYFGDSTLMETSALLTWVGNTVEVCGENGDFFLGSKGEVVELYDATTGRYLGSKVKETISSIQYNTYWFNLASIGGINSVRVVDESHGNGLLASTSPCTVYLNGSPEYFSPTLVGGLGTKMRSRRYDIEMKKTYYYVYDGEEFEKIEIEIPMIFVQAENYGTLVSDVYSENGLSIVNNVPQSTVTILDLYYEDGLKAYEDIAGLITPQAIAAYVGIKDKWFN